MTLNNSMSITPSPPGHAKRIKFEHGSVLGGKTRAARVSSQWKSTVSFYANGNLLYLKGESGTACAVEGGDGTLFTLDGSSAQIYEGNEAAGLRLDINNVIDYAIFFCGFLRAADGDAFRFVEERGDWGLDTGLTPSDLTPQAKSAVDGSGSFEIMAYVAHCKGLFRAL